MLRHNTSKLGASLPSSTGLIHIYTHPTETCASLRTCLFRGVLCGGGSTDAGGSSSGTTITRPGLFDAKPDVTVALFSPGPKVAVAITGPDRGVSTLQQQQQKQQCQQGDYSVASERA